MAGVDVAALRRAIEREFVTAPPTICVIGLSGVGKSSTINAMFGTDKAVSATTRGTHRFRADTFAIHSERVDGVPLAAALRVVDAPGLGEDAALDANYLKRYREHLPKADLALWVVAARNRALALDQQYLDALRSVLPHAVIGINQVDLVDPLDWDGRINMPSLAQDVAIQAIVTDRAAKLGPHFRAPPKAIAYSARHYFNLQALFAALIDAAPPKRRWMFDLVKSFSTADWLAQAKGLSEAQRNALRERHGAGDRKLDAAALTRR
jgi:predicted GTPase